MEDGLRSRLSCDKSYDTLYKYMLTHQAIEEDSEFSSNVLFVEARMAGLIQGRITTVFISTPGTIKSISYNT